MPLQLPAPILTALVLTLAPLAAQTNWTQLAPTASPTPRTKGQLAHLLTTGNVLMFGGINNSQIYLNETWTFDGTTWTQENPTSVPQGRIQSRLVYDLLRNVVVMWSGYPGGNGYVQDLWEWVPNNGSPGNSGNWQQVQPQPSNTWPAQRDHMAMCFDLPRGRTLMFGGWSYFAQQTLFNDLWAWNGTIWTQLSPTNAPPSGRDGHDMVIDEARGQIVLFGGGRAFGAALGDTWTYDLATDTWTQRTPTSSPSARFNHSMVYDAARERVVLFGGRTSSQTFNDVWEWDGSNWALRTTPTSPSVRQYGRMAYDPIREDILMFGGDINSSFGGGNNETWRYGPVTSARWTNFGPGCSGNSPSAAIPGLDGGARPWIGTTAAVHLSGLPTASVAFVTAGFSNTSSALGPLPFNLAPFGLTLNCFLHVEPLVTVALLPVATTATFNLNLPSDPGLLGIDVYLQAAATEGATNFVLTNAVQGTIGGR